MTPPPLSSPKLALTVRGGGDRNHRIADLGEPRRGYPGAAQGSDRWAMDKARDGHIPNRRGAVRINFSPHSSTPRFAIEPPVFVPRRFTWKPRSDQNARLRDHTEPGGEVCVRAVLSLLGNHYRTDVMAAVARGAQRPPREHVALQTACAALSPLCERRRLSSRRLVARLSPFRPAGIRFHILFGG
jgi:hypothetical protein